MTVFELFYRFIRPFDHPLYQRVFKVLSQIQKRIDQPINVLDVGGRRSNYTIGLKSRIIISEVPRESDLQHDLDLGATDELRKKVLNRRTNIKDFIYDDMTQTSLPENNYDLVIAIEVLEHVDMDDAFVRNVMRILKPGGYFVMTTPNGDFLKIPYPDHKRHYELIQLDRLLSQYFTNVNIQYVVNAGWLIRIGVHKPSIKAPFRTLLSLPALFLSYHLEIAGFGGSGPKGKRHLLAIVQK